MKTNKCDDAAIRALLTVEWEQNGGGTFTCHGCGGWTFDPTSHNEDCTVDAALNAFGLVTARLRVEEKLRRGIHPPESPAVFGKLAKRKTKKE